MSSPTEKRSIQLMLTQWEMELKLLEDWLDNPEPEKDYQDDSHAKRRRIPA
jgi:hypothetical protein